MSLIVRDIVPDDAEALAQIIVTATQQNFAGLVPDVCLTWLTEEEQTAVHAHAEAEGIDSSAALLTADIAKSAANWRQSLTHEVEPDEILLIAEYDGIPAGYAMADSCTDDPEYQGELSGLYVHPAHQGQGVGRVLLTEIAVRLAAQGIYSLRVGVLRVNPSRAFYERMGGQYLYDRDHNWDGVIVPECFYGWKDTRELQQKT